MTDILFLDDCQLRTRHFQSSIPSATLTQTAAGCIDELKNGPWDIVFLDHDLGGEIYVESERDDCGMEVVRWIVANKPKIGKIIVHTHNTKAGNAMEEALLNAGYDVEYKKFGSIDFREYENG